MREIDIMQAAIIFKQTLFRGAHAGSRAGDAASPSQTFREVFGEAAKRTPEAGVLL